MSDEQTPNAVALPSASVDTSSLSALAEIIGGSRTPFYTSIDTRTPEGKALLFRVSEDTDVSGDDIIGAEVKVANVYISKAEKNSLVTGEVTSLTRVVLIDASGKSYATFSDGIAESVRKLIGIYGLPPWNPGVSVRIAKRKTSSGFTMFYLAPIIPPNPKSATK